VGDPSLLEALPDFVDINASKADLRAHHHRAGVGEAPGEAVELRSGLYKLRRGRRTIENLPSVT
jgi:hypothetical protein